VAVSPDKTLQVAEDSLVIVHDRGSLAPSEGPVKVH
jgi:hypothetical protein